jgi:hypothetical protein
MDLKTAQQVTLATATEHARHCKEQGMDERVIVIAPCEGSPGWAMAAHNISIADLPKFLLFISEQMTSAKAKVAVKPSDLN